MKMGLSKPSLLIGLLFSAVLLVSARELSETADKKEPVEESKYHGGGYHGGYHHGYHGGHGGHYPPTTERKTLQTDNVKPDYYYHHHPHYYHGGHGGHYPPTTERKTLESSDVKPDYHHGGYGGGGYGYGHHGGYGGGGYGYGHHGGGYGYGHHGGYGGHYPPQGKDAEKGN